VPSENRNVATDLPLLMIQSTVHGAPGGVGQNAVAVLDDMSGRFPAGGDAAGTAFADGALAAPALPTAGDATIASVAMHRPAARIVLLFRGVIRASLVVNYGHELVCAT
jgi:hypothetical protein